jgi:hypothetical protein
MIDSQTTINVFDTRTRNVRPINVFQAISAFMNAETAAGRPAPESELSRTVTHVTTAELQSLRQVFESAKLFVDLPEYTPAALCRRAKDGLVRAVLTAKMNTPGASDGSPHPDAPDCRHGYSNG